MASLADNVRAVNRKAHQISSILLTTRIWKRTAIIVRSANRAIREILSSAVVADFTYLDRKFRN